MKQPDCAFTLDVKNTHTFLNRIIIWGDMPHQRRGGGSKKTCVTSNMAKGRVEHTSFLDTIPPRNGDNFPAAR